MANYLIHLLSSSRLLTCWVSSRSAGTMTPLPGTKPFTPPTEAKMTISPQSHQYQDNLNFQANLPFAIGNWWNMNYDLIGGWHRFKLGYSGYFSLELTDCSYSDIK